MLMTYKLVTHRYGLQSLRHKFFSRDSDWSRISHRNSLCSALSQHHRARSQSQGAFRSPFRIRWRSGWVSEISPRRVRLHKPGSKEEQGSDGGELHAWFFFFWWLERKADGVEKN